MKKKLNEDNFSEILQVEESNRLQYRLQFFADGPGGEKTELPTAKKLSDARDEGQVAKSNELLIATSLYGLFLSLKLFVGKIGNEFLLLFQTYYANIDKISSEDFNINTASLLLKNGILDIIRIILPLILIAVVIAFASNIVQIKWKITGKPLRPKFDKLSPLKGFKNLFSKDKVMELLKAILKVGALGYISYNTLKDNVDMIALLYDISIGQAIVLIGTVVIDLGTDVSLVFLIFGIADFAYQKLKFKKDMMMTKQEIKDEYKQSEGDPHTKGKIKSKMREVSQRRMMQQLPEADVVITNPTHFAAAIKYDKNTSEAPILIAKGADYIAEKIKEAARENKIEIVENKPLARMLYYNVEIGDEIPAELYQMTAEVLAYVYGLKNNN